MESKKTLFSTRDLVIIGLFSALAYVLMLLESGLSWVSSYRVQ